MTNWRPDVLGAGLEYRELDLGSDDEGPLVATLVRALPTLPRWWHAGEQWQRLVSRPALADVDVLYVHGWSDYFFQRELAEFWTARGARFYALDLRKYGRSLRPGQTPGYIEQLESYDAEIELALEVMQGDAKARHPSERRLVLLGHSTGGLVLSLWAARNPGVAAALILNSPWLEFQLSGRIRQFVMPIIDLSARLNPREAAPQLDYGYYSRAQQEVAEATDGPGINPEWRPDRSHAVHAGWLRAILEGHSRVDQGLGIDVPVCVLLSRRSQIPARWSEELTRVDTVLDVDQIAQAALKLGDSVTIERINGALHDVFLSRHAARREAYARLDRWTRGWALPRS